MIDRLKAYITLNFENIRLTLAEKIILLLSAVLTVLVALIFGGVAFLLITLGLAQVLSLWLPLWLSYVIMAGISVALLLVVLIFRRALIINPISRAVSKIIMS